MSSVLHFLADQQAVPDRSRELIEKLVRKEQIENSNLIHLFCPRQDSFKVAQTKWALVFLSLTELNAFISEVESSEDKQQLLFIEEFCVFDNVMFVTLQSPQRLHLWAESIIEHITSQPLVVFVVKNSFDQLTYLAQKNACVLFKSLLPQEKGSKRKASSEEDEKEAEDDEEEEEDGQQSSSKDGPAREKKRKVESANGGFNGLSNAMRPTRAMAEDDQLVINAMKEFSIGLLSKLSNMTEYISGLISVLSKMQQQKEIVSKPSN